uniref:BVpp69b protein n=1 Tax=Chelonus inanitus TaxID=49201 RepID=D7FB26_9HYME|nr:BVpp69b protein [Chelonus inanitus]
MNAADMLYSPGETLKVKLNIAGIIIESKRNLLPAIADYSDKEYLSVESLVRGVTHSEYPYFEKSKLNPNMSYDWIFFLTSKKLSYSDRHNLTRMSTYPKRGIVRSRQEGCRSFIIPISIITDDYEFISYPTIGHEIFHLIIHGSHKEIENRTCHLGFLDAYDVPNLEKFQWSDDCCLLTNKPQSLNFQQLSMDSIIQCQCYGYEKNYFETSTECTEMLICEDAKKNEQSVPRIVDDEFCRDKWEKKRQKLITSLNIGTSTGPTTTEKFIPP